MKKENLYTFEVSQDMKQSVLYRKLLLECLSVQEAVKVSFKKLLWEWGAYIFLAIDYDRLGRLIVSQNTKQHNYKKQVYSYTLYDALNRITEVGQKTENTSSTKFTSIFGDTVLTSQINPAIISQSKFLAWIKDNTGPRTEVTHSYYDVQNILPKNVLVQNELRNRVATKTYADTLRSDSLVFNNSESFSYDVHGNVQTVIQDDSVYNVGTGQRYKRIDYQYDLVSGNVNEVDYQNDSLDQYHHKYTYDADNRMIQVQTSKDSVNWDCDASYFYYLHGPLARMELGDQQVQGMDYAYTLQGWPKAVNSDKLTANNDMGHDAQQSGTNLNRYFARDAFGYSIKYFDKTPNPNSATDFPGDYDAIDTATWNHVAKCFEAKTYGSELTNNRRDLFNENITAMATNIQQPQKYSESMPTQTAILLPQGTAYGYDQLNRMVEMKAFQNLDTTTNVWGTGTYNGLYHNWLTYDENGNILTQKRADSLGNIFDSLTYHYNTQSGITTQNRLYHVNDAANVSTVHDDIKDEGTFYSTEATINQKNNYRYNAIGQLAKDTMGGIDTIIWTNYDKVWKIKKHSGDSIIFAYDGNHNRILKEVKPYSGNSVITYYVRDATGNIISVYTQQSVGMSMSYTQTERDIYGKSRLGDDKTPVQLVSTLGQALKVDTFKRYLGDKEYELNNYLQNVQAIVSDRKIARPNGTHDSINHYEADVVASQDYFPGGFPEMGRAFSSASYRYGMNGQEKDDEITGYTGTDYTAEFWEYDTRLWKRWDREPKQDKYTAWSPYSTFTDNPILNSDLNGNDPNDPGGDDKTSTTSSTSTTSTTTPPAASTYSVSVTDYSGPASGSSANKAPVPSAWDAITAKITIGAQAGAEVTVAGDKAFSLHGNAGSTDLVGINKGNFSHIGQENNPTYSGGDIGFAGIGLSTQTETTNTSETQIAKVGSSEVLVTTKKTTEQTTTSALVDIFSYSTSNTKETTTVNNGNPTTTSTNNGTSKGLTKQPDPFKIKNTGIKVSLIIGVELNFDYNTFMKAFQ